MLVLSRRRDDEIVIGENITIKILSVLRGKVKLGIDAPDEVGIRRGEVEVEIAVADADRSVSETQPIQGGYGAIIEEQNKNPDESQKVFHEGSQRTRRAAG